MKTKLNSKMTKSKATKVVKDIRRANRKLYSAKDNIRIVIEGLGVKVKVRACTSPIFYTARAFMNKRLDGAWRVGGRSSRC